MNETKIARLSRFLKIAFLTAACLLPIIDAGYWITNGYPFLKPWMDCNFLPKLDPSAVKPLVEMTSTVKFFGFIATLIPTSLNVLAFLLLATLFHFFQKLEIFSAGTVKCLRRLGLCIFLNSLVYPFYVAILSVVLTITNPPGHRMISVSFGMEQFNLLIIGAIIILISWIMDEGRKLQEENAATV